MKQFKKPKMFTNLTLDEKVKKCNHEINHVWEGDGSDEEMLSQIKNILHKWFNEVPEQQDGDCPGCAFMNCQCGVPVELCEGNIWEER